MQIKLYILLIIMLNNYLLFSQGKVELLKVGRNKTIILNENDQFSIKLKSDSDDMLEVFGYQIKSMKSDTLYTISNSYNSHLKKYEYVEVRTPIKDIDKIGLSRADKCQPSMFMFLGPAIILGSPLIALDENGKFILKDFFIGLTVGVGVTVATYLLSIRCRPKVYDIGEKWIFWNAPNGTFDKK